MRSLLARVRRTLVRPTPALLVTTAVLSEEDAKQLRARFRDFALVHGVDAAQRVPARQLFGGLATKPVVSLYLRSGCCRAPVRQEYEQRTDTHPVVCMRCGRVAGAPGGEDVAS